MHENVTSIFLVKGVFPGPGGGAIFFGKDSKGQEVSASVTYKWKNRIPSVDEVWRVEGRRNPRSKHPETIKAKKAAPVVPPIGELTRRFLCEADQFRNFGFGKGKLDTLEKGLAKAGVSVRAALNEGQIDLMSKFLPIGMVENLVEAWQQSVKDCDIYEFLDEYGFDRSLATSIRRVFKTNVVARLKDNPYRLLAFGTSSDNMWKKADLTAKLLGVDRKDPRRLAASIEQAFYDRLADGHTLTTLEELKPLVMGLLRTKSENLFEDAVRAAAKRKIVVKCAGGLQALGPASMEAYVESRLVDLANMTNADCQMGLFSPDADQLGLYLTEANAEFTKVHGSGLNPLQLEAVQAICSSFLCVISGGAGTGKTTILRAAHSIVERTGGTIFQVALAGRAKERLEEATSRKAYTIRGFIERIKKGKDAPGSKGSIVVEEGAYIVIDEASMCDLTLVHSLLILLPEKVKLCFVGDIGQLAPMGFGVVFHRIVGIPGVRTVELTEIVRQEDITGIPGFSREVRAGRIPDLPVFSGAVDGVSFLSITDGEDMPAALYEVSKQLGHDCQVLCVRRRFGKDSSNKVNRYFQYRFADAQHDVHLARWKIFVNDPIIVTRNSYDLNLFNGTLGVLARLEGHDPVFRFGNKKEFKLDDEQMVEVGIELAFGITVHKAQGSEFNRVVVPVTKSRGLDRSLLYTALTRARRQVVFVGDRDAFIAAVEAEPQISSISVGFDLRAALAVRRMR